MGTVLVVAAMPVEIAGIRSALTPAQRTVFRFVAEGPGFRLARKAVAEISEKPRALVSAGLCGALDERLRLGDIVVAESVNGVSCEMPRAGRPFVHGPVLSQDRVAVSAAEKRALQSSGAIAVEMEAAVLMEKSREWGVPFFCIRAVSDTVGEDFELDLNAARDALGRFSIWKVLGQAARRPLVAVPELLRLKRNSEVAAKRLGEFFADCSF